MEEGEGLVSRLTYGASVRPETAVTYSAGNEGQKICGGFSETAPLQRSSTPSVVRPCVQSAIFLRKARMRIIVFTTWWTGSGYFLLRAGLSSHYPAYPQNHCATNELFVGLIMQYHYVGLDKIPEPAPPVADKPVLSDQPNQPKRPDSEPHSDNELDDATLLKVMSTEYKSAHQLAV